MTHSSRRDLHIQRLERIIEQLIEEVNDQRMKLRLVMGICRVNIAPTSAIIGPNDQPIAPETVDLHTMYHHRGGREMVAAQMRREDEAIAEQARAASVATPPDAEPSSNGDGRDADASHVTPFRRTH